MSDKFNEMSDEAQNIFFPLEIIELQEILGQIGLGQNTCIYIHVITGCCIGLGTPFLLMGPC